MISRACQFERVQMMRKCLREKTGFSEVSRAAFAPWFCFSCAIFCRAHLCRAKSRFSESTRALRVQVCGPKCEILGENVWARGADLDSLGENVRCQSSVVPCNATVRQTHPFTRSPLRPLPHGRGSANRLPPSAFPFPPSAFFSLLLSPHRLPSAFQTNYNDTAYPGEDFLNARPFTISCLTVGLLIALRVAVGWHFFQEGLSHKNDPKWSSEGFLRQAKGPLAPLYKGRLPDFHGWDRNLVVPFEKVKEGDDSIAAGGSPESEAGADKQNAPPKPQDSSVYGKWYADTVRDWTQRRQEIANFYHFSDEQLKATDVLLDRYSDRLKDLLAGYESDIRAYRHGLNRNQEMAAEPGSDAIPNLNARLAKRAANPTGEPGVTNYVATTPADWRGDAEALEKSLEKEIAAVATADQSKLGPLVENTTELKKIDTAVIWTLIIGGACLVVGLFTRLSAVVLALFLASVMASQPPWVAGAMTTVFNYQLVEFIALLVLASSRVGRWGGLDFFVHHLLLRPFRRTGA